MVSKNVSLLLFVKYPREGCVKTRLAAEIGHPDAAWFYRQFVDLCMQRFPRVSELDCTIYFDPREEEDSIRNWLGRQWDYVAQPDGDLGRRLLWGFENRFTLYPYVVAAGSDSPDLPLDYLRQAAFELKKHDMVIGPAEDGGYYLIGLSRPAPELFEGIAWSTSSVFEQTMAKAAILNLRTAILPSWYDIDTHEDLLRLHRSENPSVRAIFQKHPDFK